METDFHVPTAVGTLFVFIGGLHLVLGLTGLARDLALLPTLLTLWGAFALGGVALVAADVIPAERAYTVGILMLTVALLGYVDVYGTQVVETTFGIDWGTEAIPTHDHAAADGHDHSHGQSAAGSSTALLGQLASDEIALLSKIGELVALSLLVVLKRE